MHRKLLNSFKDNSILYFLAAMLIFGIAAGLFMGSLNNYLHDILSIDKEGRGLIEFPRETPGLLLVFFLALLYRFSEINIMKIALMVSIAGMAGLYFLGESLLPAIVMIIFWSTGEHLMMPVRSSVTIHMAKPDKGGAALGVVHSLNNFGMVVGFGLVSLIFYLGRRYRLLENGFRGYQTVFIVTIIILVLAWLAANRTRDTKKHIKRKRLFFSKVYWRYYVLECLFGARKQIFLTFAPYVLIIHYEVRTEVISLLYLIAHIVNIFAGPMIGRLIDRFGYRTVIIVDTLVLFVLCVLYGFTHHIFPDQAAYYIICLVFILDAVLIVAGMAKTVYAKTISSSQEETTSTLSTGLSVNHVISIVIAMVGGVFWKKTGVEMLFTVAAAFALGSFAFSLTIPRKSRKG